MGLYGWCGICDVMDDVVEICILFYVRLDMVLFIRVSFGFG